MSVRIAIVGSANLDLTVRVPYLPAEGETVAATDLRRSVGGKGANQAMAAARLGADAAFVGAVGSDDFGAELRAGLVAAGLDVEHLRTIPDVATGLALIQVRPDGENTITISAGANGRLIAADVDAAAGVIAAADVLLVQLEVPPAVVDAAARAASGLVVLNAAPLPADPRDLVHLLRLVDVLVVNEVEAAGIAAAVGTPSGDDWAGTARDLLRLGPRTVVVTLGRHGAVAATDGDRGAVEVPAYVVPVVDAVGAGDAFCAEIALALARGVDVAAAVRRACAAGALATTAPGAQGAPLSEGLVSAVVDGGRVVAPLLAREA